MGDPLINDYFAIALGLATREEIDTITEYAFKINEVYKAYFANAGIELIDFKIEFGRYKGQIILADETSPDTAGCGISIRMKSWTRTASAGIWGMWKRLIMRCLSGWDCRLGVL